MAKLSSVQIRSIKHALIGKHGAKCSNFEVCHNDFSKLNAQKLYRNIVLDHIDNNPHNNQDNNYQLLCRRCNRKKNPSAIISALRNGQLTLDYIYTDKKQIIAESLRIESVAMAKHLYGDKAFRKLVHDEVFRKPEGVLLNDLITEGIEVARLRKSVLVEKLEGMCSPKGLYMVYDFNGNKFIKFRSPSEVSSKDFQKKFST